MEQKSQGWKGIGRSLVVATVGPDSLCEQLHSRNVVVIGLEGTALELARRRSLSPDLVDAVVIDVTEEDREEKLELSRILRGRYLATILVLPKERWGKRVLRVQLGVFRSQGKVGAEDLWIGVSVAAQQTWALGWLRPDKGRVIQEVSSVGKEPALGIHKGTVAKDLGEATSPEIPRAIASRTARPSRTMPWAPPPDLLVELTKAYTDK